MLEFDGISWRLIDLPNNLTARSAEISQDGRIYVGSVGDLGFLAPNHVGQLEFVSLLEDVPEDRRDFTDVWETHIMGDDVYFRTSNYQFRWDGAQFKSWESLGSGYHVGSVVHGELYVRQWDYGLTKMVDDEFVLVPGGERFALERIYVMLEYDDERIMVVTRTQGVFLFDGETFEPFETEADDLLLTGQIYSPGMELTDGTLALGTVYGGLIRIDRNGKLVQHLTMDTGLINDGIYTLMQDRSGELWLGTDVGISKVELGSPLTIFDERSGASSSGYTVAEHDGEVYLGYLGGVMRLDAESSRFQPIAGIAEQVFGLLSVGDELLAAGTQVGLFTISDGATAQVAVGSADASYSAWDMKQTPWDEDLVFVGLSDGLSLIQRTGLGQWRELGRVETLGNATSVVVEEPGVVWVGIATRGAYRISFPIEAGIPQMSEAEVEYFGEEHGLPETGIGVYKAGGENYFFSSNSIYQFDPATRSFVPDKTFHYADFSLQGYLVDDDSGRVFVLLDEQLAVATPDGSGDYSWTRPLRRLEESQIRWIHPESSGGVWLITLDGIVHVDPFGAELKEGDLQTLVRAVSMDGDSLIFGGYLEPSMSTAELPHGHTEIRFDFAATSYVAPEQTRFKSRLVGFDRGWSDWRRETSKTYTNIPPGDYQFEVLARDASGRESQAASFSLQILPPWYATWWAYLIYVGLFGSMLYGFVRVRTGQLQARQRELEKTVEERTTEVRSLLKQSDQRAKELGTVNEISKALVSQLEFDALVQLVGEEIQKTFNADIAYVALLDEERKMINFPYGYGEAFPPIEFGKGLTSQIIETGEPLLINEDVTASYEKMGREEVGEQVASYLGVPIYEGKEVVGVVSVQSKHLEGRFNEDDQRLLTTIAANVGIALQNAESYLKLNKTLEDLRATQEQLVTQEKMASLGQLTAGIAHEIKNPLNFVNNFADLVSEMAKELDEELTARQGLTVSAAMEELADILQGLKINASQIQKHGKRADSIVRNMMQHASGGTTERYPIEVNAFVDEYVGLAFHGARAQNPDLIVDIERDYDEHAGNVVMTPQEMGRVMVNLLNNAFYAVTEHSKSAGEAYTPRVTIRTHRRGTMLDIVVEDNGPGIPEAVRDKIFQPLFTTKPTGSGTGLGLSLSFEIVTHGHNGKLNVESTEGEGAKFTISIPV
jgi:signal transduction histidine kinase